MIKNNKKRVKLYARVYKGKVITGYNKDMLVEYINTLKYNSSK